MREWSDEARQLYAYWQSIAPMEGVLPGRQHLNPEDIKDLLAYVWLLDVEDEPSNYRYRLVGTSVVNWIGKECTGKRLRDVNPEIETNAEQFEFFKTVVEKHEPHWYRGVPRSSHRADVVELENLILPLASDGKNTDVLLGLALFFDQDGKRIY